MLKKYSQVFLSILLISDAVLIGLSWWFAYYLRFYSGIFSVAEAVPPFDQYLILTLPIILVFGLNFKLFGVYLPLRGKSQWYDYYNLFRSSIVSCLILTSLLFFYRGESFSRLTVALFAVLIILALVGSHCAIRNVLFYFRRRSHNLRHVLIVGTGKLADELVRRFDLHPEMGFSVLGYLTDEKEELGRFFSGHKVLGLIQDCSQWVREGKVDQLFITLPLEAHHRLEDTLKSLKDEAVEIKVVPDLLKFMSLRSGIDDFDGLPVVNLSESPLYGWNGVIKRMTDILVSSVGLLILSPLMLLIALIIKVGSRGPVFFVQDRVGLDENVFRMFKFRSMKTDAEEQSGPVWAERDDERVTVLGRFLRRTSLDELPQLWNVLKGDMSMVGPRPERPVFVDNFRSSIPQYMLRTRMKAGLTGWAQVNGWRGNTSIEKRIEHDIYYIQNWSWVFDTKIMILTLWRGLINKNAY